MRSRSSNTSKRKGFGKSTTLPNRASRGLYHGRTVGFGNNVSFSERHTRRKFKPNVQDVRLWSQTLKTFIRFNATTAAIKAIDEKGGLDAYLLNNREDYVNSSEGLLVKRRIEYTLRRRGALSPPDDEDGGAADGDGDGVAADPAEADAPAGAASA